MSTKTRTAKLIGWIRFLPAGDGYGIPLFKGSGNAPLTPETDDDLRITRFHEFYNEAGYTESSSLPPKFHEAKYRIGDALPIPFIIGGKASVVLAGTDPRDFLKSQGEQSRRPTIRAIVGVLTAVTEGEYRKISSEKQAAAFRLEHDEILSGEPAHSRYWIQQFKTASIALKRMSPQAREIAAIVLRRKAIAWLDKLGSKSDMRLCREVLKSSTAASVVQQREAKHFVLRLVFLKFYADRDSAALGSIAALVKEWLPEGAFTFYLEAGLWEGAHSATLKQARNIPLMFLETLNAAYSEGDLKKALSLSIGLFGSEDLPLEISRTVAALAQRAQADLTEQLKLGFPASARRRALTASQSNLARGLLKRHEEVILLYRILHGDARRTPEQLPKSIGVPQSILPELRGMVMYGPSE